jgi:hypothetical protein
MYHWKEYYKIKKKPANSLSLKNHWKRSRRKKSFLSSIALPLSTSLSNIDLDKKNEKRPYFVGGGDGAGSRVEKVAIVFWLGAYHAAAALG